MRPCAVLPLESAAAHAQCYLTFALQVSFGLAMLLLTPGADRLDNHVTALQFLLEGTQTLLLIRWAAASLTASVPPTLISLHPPRSPAPGLPVPSARLCLLS